MKKLIFALLIGSLLLLSLCACNQSNNNESTTLENTTESVSPDATTPEGTTSANTPDTTIPEDTTSANAPDESTSEDITSPNTPEETTIPDNTPDETTTPDDAVDTIPVERPQVLNEIFKMLEGDASINSEIEFSHSEYDEKLHYELKQSGLYDTDEWSESAFQVIIWCNYKDVTNEVWYKQIAHVHSQTNAKILNEAFYNYCKDDFSGGEFSNIAFIDGLFFLYTSPDEFLADYTAMKALLALEYVSSIEIGYIYGLPSGYVTE